MTAHLGADDAGSLRIYQVKQLASHLTNVPIYDSKIRLVILKGHNESGWFNHQKRQNCISIGSSILSIRLLRKVNQSLLSWGRQWNTCWNIEIPVQTPACSAPNTEKQGRRRAARRGGVLREAAVRDDGEERRVAVFPTRRHGNPRRWW
jgi:hypothetical protein